MKPRLHGHCAVRPHRAFTSRGSGRKSALCWGHRGLRVCRRVCWKLFFHCGKACEDSKHSKIVYEGHGVKRQIMGMLISQVYELCAKRWCIVRPTGNWAALLQYSFFSCPQTHGRDKRLHLVKSYHLAGEKSCKNIKGIKWEVSHVSFVSVCGGGLCAVPVQPSAGVFDLCCTAGTEKTFLWAAADALSPLCWHSLN